MDKSVSAIGTFVSVDGHVFRTDAQIQFGKSNQSLGILYMLNPGESYLLDKTLWEMLNPPGGAKTPVFKRGEVMLDDTMKAVVAILQEAHPQPEGILHIQNVFNVRNTDMKEAIRLYEILHRDERFKEYIHSPMMDVTDIPWVWIGWTVEDRASLNPRKKQILSQVQDKPLFALYSRQKKHQRQKELYTYHPYPRLSSDQEWYFTQMTAIMKVHFNREF